MRVLAGHMNTLLLKIPFKYLSLPQYFSIQTPKGVPGEARGEILKLSRAFPVCLQEVIFLHTTLLYLSLLMTHNMNGEVEQRGITNASHCMLLFDING